MVSLRYAWVWLVAGLALLYAGLVVALSPVPAVVAVTLNDKFLHMAAFAFFMLWFGGVFEARLAPFIVVALSAYGLLIELLQSLTRTRQGDFLDLIADVTGVLLGWVLCAAGFSRWCVKLESWIPRQNP